MPTRPMEMAGLQLLLEAWARALVMAGPLALPAVQLRVQAMVVPRPLPVARQLVERPERAVPQVSLAERAEIRPTAQAARRLLLAEPEKGIWLEVSRA